MASILGECLGVTNSIVESARIGTMAGCQNSLDCLEKVSKFEQFLHLGNRYSPSRCSPAGRDRLLSVGLVNAVAEIRKSRPALLSTRQEV